MQIATFVYKNELFEKIEVTDHPNFAFPLGNDHDQAIDGSKTDKVLFGKEADIAVSLNRSTTGKRDVKTGQNEPCTRSNPFLNSSN